MSRFVVWYGDGDGGDSDDDEEMIVVKLIY